MLFSCLLIFFSKFTVKIILEAWAFIRAITLHRDGGRPLLEATGARKVIHPVAPDYQ